MDAVARVASSLGKQRGLQPGEQDAPGSSRARQRSPPSPAVVSKVFQKAAWAPSHHGCVMARMSLKPISGETTLTLPEAPGPRSSFQASE